MPSLLWPGVGRTFAPETPHIREAAGRLRVARKTGQAMAQHDEVPPLKIRSQRCVHEIHFDARATRRKGT